MASNSLDLEAAVKEIFREYSAQAEIVANRVIPAVAKDAAKKLQTQADTPRRSGKYAKSWTVTVEKSRLKVHAIVHAKKPGYRLAHLLEYGHARRGGGRNVDAIVHITPVEELATNEAFDRIVTELEGMTI